MKNRKGIVLLSISILLLQAVLFPLNTILYHSVYAEEHTLDSGTEETTSSDVNTIEYVEPHFYFEEQQITGNVNTIIPVRVLSDQAVKEIKINLPQESLINDTSLPSGMTVIA